MSASHSKQKSILLSPSYLSEEDLETYIATEIDEMTKHFIYTLKPYQKGSKITADDYANVRSENLLDKQKFKMSAVAFPENGSLGQALRTKIDLVEMQYQTFMKEIEKQPKGVFKLKEKNCLKKKIKELETTYSVLIKTLKKKLQQVEIGHPSVKVDQHYTDKSRFLLKQKTAVTIDIPTIAAKINIVLEQTNEGLNNLRRIKCDIDKYFQNLKCGIKKRVDPYNKNSDKQMSLEAAEKIMSQIELDISYIDHEYEKLISQMEQKKQIITVNLQKLHHLEFLLNILFSKFYEVQLEYRKDEEVLQRKQNQLFANGNLPKDDESACLSEIKRKREELKNSYNSAYLSLQGQIRELEEEATATAYIENLFPSLSFSDCDCFETFIAAFVTKYDTFLLEIDK